MKLRIKNISITIEEIFVVFIFVICLSPTVRKFFSGYIFCYSFIVFHECSHTLVAGMFGNKLKQINLRLCGINAEIELKNKLTSKCILIYLAGPLSNIILALIFLDIKIVRDINIGLAIINILPIYPLDGFNILYVIFCWYMSKKQANNILNLIQKGCLFFLIIVGVLTFIIYKNPSVVIFCIYVILIIS